METGGYATEIDAAKLLTMRSAAHERRGNEDDARVVYGQTLRQRSGCKVCQ